MNIFESNEAQFGERATEKAHRKIELQSPADLTYLIANVQRAAREKLDRHLPPDAAAGEDALRRMVEELVDAVRADILETRKWHADFKQKYIRDTFNAAKNGMSINGMDSKELDAELAKAQEGEEIEPFDSKLAQRIQDLSSQIETHTLQLANLRRTAPMETSQRFQESFDRESERNEARLRKDEAEKVDMAKKTELDVGDVQRLDEVRSTWLSGQEKLVGLKTRLGGTVARMEKATKAVDILEQ